VYVRIPAATEAICVKLLQLLPVQRSILKPVSLLELSVHESLNCIEADTVTLRLLGAAGSDAEIVLALAMFE
jgi:hypothetical protein